MFRAPEISDTRRLTDQDMSIWVNADKIYLHFTDDAGHCFKPWKCPESRYSQALTALKAYLDEQTINSLIRPGDKKNEAPAVLTKSKTQKPQQVDMISFIDSLGLVSEVRTHLANPADDLANKYLYLGEHGAWAWKQVEERLHIKRFAHALLLDHIDDISKIVLSGVDGYSVDIVSLGTGTGQDDIDIMRGLYLKTDRKDFSVFTLDISRDLLNIGTSKIKNHIDTNMMHNIKLSSICIDIEMLDNPAMLKFMEARKLNANRLYHLLGLTLGNNRELSFLKKISQTMQRGDFLLIGVDFSVDKEDDLQSTYHSYRDACAEVDIFLSGPLKTAVNFIAPETGMRIIEAVGSLGTRQRDFDFAKEGIRIHTEKDEKAYEKGISNIPGTVSFTRYYTEKSESEFNMNAAKLCDFSNKYSSAKFKQWIIDNDESLHLEIVNSDTDEWKKWNKHGQTLVLLRKKA